MCSLCDSPDQAAHYHTISPKLNKGFISELALGWSQSKSYFSLYEVLIGFVNRWFISAMNIKFN
jgi:hypothetical protein